MKILSQRVEKDGKGTVTLVPQDAEDMWHVYNLVVRGDWVKCSTLRKVVKTGATGTTTSEKVRVLLELEVEEVVYDPKAEQIRIKGGSKSARLLGRGTGTTMCLPPPPFIIRPRVLVAVTPACHHSPFSFSSS